MTIINKLKQILGAKTAQHTSEEINARIEALEAKWFMPQQSVGNAIDALMMERGTLSSPNFEQVNSTAGIGGASATSGIEFGINSLSDTAELTDSDLNTSIEIFNPTTGLPMNDLGFDVSGRTFMD